MPFSEPFLTINNHVGEAANGEATPKLPSGGSILCDSSFWTAVLTITNTALGAGLLSVPFAFMSAGYAGGLIATALLVSVCCLALYAIMIRMSWAQELDSTVKGFGALVRWGAGVRTSWFVDTLVFLNCFGACIGYQVVLGDTLTPLIAGSLAKLPLSPRTILLLATAIPCLGLSLLRQISALKYTAGIAVFACFYTTGLLIERAYSDPCRSGDCWSPQDEGMGEGLGWCTEAEAKVPNYNCSKDAPTRGVAPWPMGAVSLLTAIPLVLNGLQCHIQAAFIYAETPTRLRSSRSTWLIAIVPMIFLLLVYSSAGIAGYWRFGGLTKADALNNFADDDPLADIARVAVAITALSAYPMQHVRPRCTPSRAVPRSMRHPPRGLA
jgi:amino acid permease